MRQERVTTLAILAMVMSAPGSAASAAAQSNCQQYVGQEATTISFEELLAAVPQSALKKDPFETTAAFNERVAQANSKFGAPLIVRQELKDILVGYDADNGSLSVSAFAFGRSPDDVEGVLDPAGQIIGRLKGNGALAFTIRETPTGKRNYETTNGFGAKVTVEESSRDVAIVWERPLQLGELQFPKVAKYRLAEVPMTPEIARATLADIATALVLVPRQPYVTRGKTESKPTFRYPTATVSNVTIVGADIQCALITTRSGKVVFAFDVK